MAYSDFSLESALAPRTKTRAVKLQGVGKAISILNSPNRGTEEFIQGAISSLGTADRMIMYVNGSLEALSDRMRTASKIAKAVNTSKARGVEGFSRVPVLDPWAYAIEGKAADFFNRVWDAIKTACRRIIDAIVYIIKWIGNAVASMDVKSQVKDYKKFTDNKAKILDAVKADKTGDKKIKALPYTMKASDFANLIKTAAAQYTKSSYDMKKDNDILNKFAKIDVKAIGKDKDKLKEALTAFGVANIAEVNKAVEATKNDMTQNLGKSLQTIFGAAKFKKDGVTITQAKGMITAALCGKTTVGEVKPTDVTLSDIYSKTGEFAILSEEWLSKNVKEVISGLHEQQKEFTKYTKSIDVVAKKLGSVAEGDTSTQLKTLSNALAYLSNARIRYNSFWSNFMLDIESCALRYRKTAHIALKHYLKAGKIDNKKDGKSKESYSYRSVEALFDFN